MTRHPRIAMLLLAGLVAGVLMSCQPPPTKAATGVIQTPLSDQPTPAPREIEKIPLPPIEMPMKPPDQMPVDPPQAPQEVAPPEESTPPEATPPEDPPVAEPPASEDSPVAEAPATRDPAPEAEPERAPEIVPEPTPTPREEPVRTAADIRDDYLRRFNAQVERHKQYPKQARRMGRQGRVVMMIQIDAGGALINLQIVQSSGHLALDAAATQAVTEAAPFPPPPQPAFDAAPTFQMGLSFELR